MLAPAATLVRKALGKLRRQLTPIPEKPVIRTIGGDVRFEFRCESFLDRGDFAAMYTQSYDIALCELLRRELRAGDVFFDVGANVGYISAVAASCVGPQGEIHGFEPLPECFRRLERLASLNPRIAFNFLNTAVGATPGTQAIHYNPDGDSRNATLLPREAATVVHVPVTTLDDYVAQRLGKGKRISMIKIDVEGFEFPVLQGARRVLAQHEPVVICEIKPWEIEKLGSTMAVFADYMAEAGYVAYDSVFTSRRMDIASLQDLTVAVFRRLPLA